MPYENFKSKNPLAAKIAANARKFDVQTLQNEDLVNLLLSEGVFNDERHESLDVMEFFGAEVDLDEILRSETEAFKSDYFYCEECKN
ncbi:hypothetical protein [uncultured Campylobacter sp.]|uniref:hypothetical protein n=1 Tax=uncultured Campylobacter sp. TaxID=218934 RepID=UPI002616B682|nr:hypothetical protein [uncultured Campylobacter sp.]